MKMNTRRLKCLSKLFLLSGFLSIIGAYIAKKARIVLSIQKDKLETETRWITKSIPKWIKQIFRNTHHEAESFNISDSLSFVCNTLSDVFKTIIEDFYILLNAPKTFLQNTGIRIISFISEFRWHFISAFIILLLVSVVVNILLKFILRRRKKRKKETTNNADSSLMVADSNSIQECPCQDRIPNNHMKRIVLYGVCGAALLSIPWEFLRLYQVEIAKRSALVQNGPPEQCSPRNSSLISYLLNGIKWYISWSHHDPCEKYYQALLVDPFWEVTPLVVLSSTVTRCIVHPLEILSHGMGKCLKLFFSEIPSQWQPIILLVIVIMLLISLIMFCSYTIRFTLPCFFVFKAMTPSQKVPSRTVIIKNRESINNSSPHKRKKIVFS